MTTDPRTLASTYLQAWTAQDFPRLRATLADDVTFRGPLGVADGVQACLQGLRGLASIMTDLLIRQMVVDGPNVMTWYDLHTTVAPPCPTVNWSHVEDGAIIAIRAVFDPRDLIRGMAEPGQSAG